MHPNHDFLVRNCLGVIVMVLSTGLLVGLVSGAGPADASEPSEAPEPAQMVDSGSWYSRQRWPHDGKPYESQNFVVYSDTASLEAKQAVAEVGEDVLAETIAEMGVDPNEMFRFPDGQDKIHIYAYHDHYPQNWGMRAYYGGLIAWSLDHEKRDTDPDLYASVVKHELVHVVESLLKGRDAIEGYRVETWFSEGLAEALTGGTSGGAVRDLDHMNHLVAEYGRLSPVTYKSDSPDWDPVAFWHYHYPMSQLAVEYLMDTDGLGRSPQDVTNLFLDMAGGPQWPQEGTDFTTAFENRMGISVSDYGEQFFGLMDGYLPEGETSTMPIIPVGIALLLTAAAGLFTWHTRSHRRSNNPA
jgi:hypothetical protein